MTGHSVPELWKDLPYPYDTTSLDLACAEAWAAKTLYDATSWWRPLRKINRHYMLYRSLRKVQDIAENRARIVVGRMYELELH